MELFFDYRNLPASRRKGPTIALGNFDGVHRGHQVVIDAARRLVPDAPLGVATFQPHPREFFSPETEPFLLTPFEEKQRKLAALGIEQLYALDFDASLSSMSPEAFVKEILVDAIGVSGVSVGGDFRFGAKRAGDAAMLSALAEEHGFVMRALEAVADEEGALYSSSSARASLRDGKPEDASAILGEPYRIRGVVEKGDQRGRTIDFPTANLMIDGILAPKFGVYAVMVEMLEGAGKGIYPGVANIGIRPTFAKTVPLLEAHIFDFNGDLYGSEIAVSLVSFLRDEHRFANLADLRAQIADDAARARELLFASDFSLPSL